MSLESRSAFERRAQLIASLAVKDPLADAAFHQFKLDYEAASGSATAKNSVRSIASGQAGSDLPETTLRLATSESESTYFEIYWADRVRLTSTRFAGGEWHWRLCTAAGIALARGGGYRSEAECFSAIEIVRRVAGAAPVRHRQDGSYS